MNIGEIEKTNSEYFGFEEEGEREPRVSVVLVINGDSTISSYKRVIRSILNQSLREIELMLIDDSGGRDDIKAFTEGLLLKEPRITLIRHKKALCLPALSFNEAVLKSRGAYITFAQEDYLLTATGLEETCAFMEEQFLSICFSKAYKKAYDRWTGDLLFDDFIPFSSVVIKRDAFFCLGLFDPSPLLQGMFFKDFLIRSIEKYNLCQTKVFYVKPLKTYKFYIDNRSNDKNPWATWEHIRHRNNQSLKLDEYYSSHPGVCLQGKSKNYRQAFELQCKKYGDAPWAEESLRLLEQAGEETEVKRILIATPGVDASVTLHFENIFSNSNLVIRYQYTLDVTAKDVDEADILIISRHLELSRGLVYWANELGVPCYYFVDDDFRSCAVDFPDSVYIREIASLTTKEYFTRFEGVIVSSEALRDSFLSDIHHNIIICSPNIKLDSVWKHESGESRLSVAFFGSGFRESFINEYILPVLKKISEKTKVTFLYPSDMKIYEEFTGIETLEILRVPRVTYLPSAIATYASLGVDIQVHPSEALNHSAFKTKNSLINATQMGAVLVVSRVLPFGNETPDKEGCYVVENTLEEWHDTLITLAENKDERERAYQNALAYCIENHSPSKTEKELKAELLKVSRKSGEKAVDPNNHRLLAIQGGSKVPFPKDSLRYCRGVKSLRRYKVSCKVSELHKIGVLFHYTGVCKGVVSVELFQKDNCVGSFEAPLEEIVSAQWWYFNLQKPLKSNNAPYTLQFSFHYSEGSPLMGFYEDRRKRAFFRKVLERFRIRLPKHDLLCVDWVGD
ncbi:MAG: glycosyltransferase [Coriobacteriia bacterium]|nr:glycosyltransferase [Coriobacteriia bacterium]MCL2749763.1 glycosyltransferase [Coriobacteriia bacterium]